MTTTTSSNRTHAASHDLGPRVLRELQSAFPLEVGPYEVVAARLGTDVSAVRAVVADARKSGLLRQISAIFDSGALGYRSTLVAMRVAPQDLDRAVAIVNAHPGVSHNYERDHEFNVWFTVAVPSGAELPAVLARIGELTGAESLRPLPALRTYKIGVSLDSEGRAQHGREDGGWYSDEQSARARSVPLSAADVAFVRAAQRDLSEAGDPFEAIGDELGVAPADAVRHAQQLVDSGHLRRFAAMLNHRRAGFSANGMVVWGVPEARVDEVGEAMASFRAVTHCYRRPSYEDWPYSLFTMIHGASTDEVSAVIDEIVAHTGDFQRRVLYSSREFKKVRLPYFTAEHEQWSELCERAAVAF